MAHTKQVIGSEFRWEGGEGCTSLGAQLCERLQELLTAESVAGGQGILHSGNRAMQDACLFGNRLPLRNINRTQEQVPWR